MNVLVTGGTGFVGNILVNRLCARDDRATIVTRTPERARTARVGVAYERWLPDVSRFDAIVHLMGESVAGKRWNDSVKRELAASRVDATRKLVDAIATLPASARRPRVLISASAVGYYGSRGDEILTESSSSADTFLGRMCVDWEREAARATDLGVRVVHLRIGIVLGRSGGALAKMTPIFRLGLGGALGWRRAWFPWIHVDDVCGMILFALDHDAARGPWNAAAPGIVTNHEFASTMGRVLSRPAIFAVPHLALRVAVGQVADALVSSQCVVPERAVAAGYSFRFPELEPALRHLLRGENVARGSREG